jgi:hypothetical protein
MRSTAILLLAILLSSPCMGQVEPPPPDVLVPVQRDQIRIGLSFSLDHTDREVTGRDGAPEAYLALYDARGFRSSRIGYTAGIDVRVPLGPKLALMTGARYADRGFRSRADAAGPGPEALPDTALITEVTHGHHFQYLDIPLLIRLEAGVTRLRPVITAGVHAGFLMGAYRVVYDEIPDVRHDGRRMEDDYELARFNLFPVLGVGLIHQTTDRIWTRLELNGAYGVLPVTSSPAGRLWNAGILMGVFYAFGAS